MIRKRTEARGRIFFRIQVRCIWKSAPERADLFWNSHRDILKCVLLRGVERQNELELPNLRFIRGEAEIITEYFAHGEIDRIYLNFSDPWPKKRNAKRRLCSHEFLSRYDQILSAQGSVEFKTDNRELFDFGVEETAVSSFQIRAITYDLHADPVLNEGNIMTEYEERFSAKGNKICKYILNRKI